MFNKKNLKYKLQGFGLIELMVSISIVVLVTGVILARHDSYNSAVLLRSQAYDIALTMREVQLLAVSAGQTGASNFRNEVGLYFSKGVNNNTFYYIYSDSNGDSRYTSGEEIGLRGNIDSRFIVSDIKLVADNGGKTSVDNISIAFKRPNFDARFFRSSGPQSPAAKVEINLSAAGGSTAAVRTIEVTKTGQIIVQSLSGTNAQDSSDNRGVVEVEEPGIVIDEPVDESNL